MTKDVRIQLDISHDYFETDDFQNDLTKHDVLYTVVEEFGPAGGNPLIDLIGSRTNVENLLRDWEFEEDEIEDFINGE